MKNIKLILGTMQFGERLFGQESHDMIETFGRLGYKELDTAYVYNDGESERLIGAYIKNSQLDFSVATKANPRITGRLDKESVLLQVNESLVRLDMQTIDLLYLHFPDPNTPIKSALEACAQLHSEGKIRKLGLSNFPAWLVSESYNICKQNGWILPTVYEGLYNPLSRNAEIELSGALDYYDMKFYAYNPLAGGLMTDKYLDKNLKEGRFVNRPNYKQRYWHDSYFDAIDKLNIVSEKYGIGITEATFRWLAYHSMLSQERGDGVIIGASSIKQLEDNVSYVEEGRLPEEVVYVINESWNICKQDAPKYFTFYKA